MKTEFDIEFNYDGEDFLDAVKIVFSLNDTEYNLFHTLYWKYIFKDIEELSGITNHIKSYMFIKNSPIEKSKEEKTKQEKSKYEILVEVPWFTKWEYLEFNRVSWTWNNIYTYQWKDFTEQYLQRYPEVFKKV